MKTYFTWGWPHSWPNCHDLCLLISLLLLAWNTAKSSSKLKVKFGSSSLISPITFSVKTLTAETLLTFAAMLNSTCHAIDTETCVSGEIHHSNNYCCNRSKMANTLCHKWISSECILRMINLMHECSYSFLLLTIKNQWLNITTFQAATTLGAMVTKIFILATWFAKLVGKEATTKNWYLKIWKQKKRPIVSIVLKW